MAGQMVASSWIGGMRTLYMVLLGNVVTLSCGSCSARLLVSNHFKNLEHVIVSKDGTFEIHMSL